jgi:RNA polymerase sigma factor (sigma-70 family)
MNTLTLPRTGRTSLANGPLRSTVVKEIINYANDPTTSVSKLSSLLLKEPGLVQRVLRKASSPLYGYARKSLTVDFAIILLGFDVLKETVASMVVNNALRNMVNVLFHYEEFWSHSLSCGFIARYLAEEHGVCDPDDAFIGGLLHDVGFLILHQYANETMQGEKKDATLNYGSAIESACGWTHSETGQWVAERWNLPPQITEAIFYHHTPHLAVHNPGLTAIVHIADVLSYKKDVGRFSFDSSSTFHPSALALVGFDEAMLDTDELQDYSKRMKTDLAGVKNFGELITDLKASFVDAISDLPEKDKIVLALYYYEGLSFDEISQILKLDEPLVHHMHADAIMKLKNVIWN